LAFDFYGKYLYSGSDDKSLIVWEVATGKQVKSIANTQAINAIAPTADLKFLYIASAEPKIKLMNMMSGQVAKTLDGHTDAVNDIAISKNGKWLVSGSNDKTARIWDMSTGKQIRILPVDCWKVTTVSFSDNDKYIVTGCNDGSVKVWETESGKLIKSFVLENAITRNVIFNKDATQVFATYMLREGDDYGVRVWATGIKPVTVIQEVKASNTIPSDTLNKIVPKNNLPTNNMNQPVVKPKK
jgi:WD40 repeat protein